MATKVSDLKGNNRPVDPDVVVPEAVRRAAERAEQIQREAYPDQVQPADKMARPTTNKDGITIVENPESTPPAEPQPTPEPQPQPTPQPTPPVTPQGNDAETWEQRYRSAEGRRVKLEQQLANAVDRMGAMEQMLQDMRSAPPAAPTPASTPSKLITSEEEEQFGTEMLDVMGRRAREIVSPEVAELKATVSRLESLLTGTVKETKRTAQQTMHAELTSKIPNWQEINQLNEFKAWLALPDPYSGATRHSMLLSAYAENDTPRVLAFFRGFVSELAATTPADDPLPTPAAPQQPPKPGLETLAAPGRARTPAQVNAPAEKQIITPDDVNAFYAAKRRGEYLGREEEFNALEQELFKAQREGRVRAR